MLYYIHDKYIFMLANQRLPIYCKNPIVFGIAYITIQDAHTWGKEYPTGDILNIVWELIRMILK